MEVGSDDETWMNENPPTEVTIRRAENNTVETVPVENILYEGLMGENLCLSSHAVILGPDGVIRARRSVGEPNYLEINVSTEMSLIKSSADQHKKKVNYTRWMSLSTQNRTPSDADAVIFGKYCYLSAALSKSVGNGRRTRRPKIREPEGKRYKISIEMEVDKDTVKSLLKL